MESVYYLLGGVLSRGGYPDAVANYRNFFRNNHTAVGLFRLGFVAVVLKFIKDWISSGFKKSVYDNRIMLMFVICTVLYPITLDLTKASYVSGDGFKYVNSQLFEPVIIFAVFMTSELSILAFSWLKGRESDRKWIGITVELLSAALICIPCFSYYDWDPVDKKDLAEWDRLYDLCDQYDSSRIYLSPFLSG